MSFGERVVGWNRWYDSIPEDWRFQFVLWSLLAVGTINMLLTVSTGFPFGLLVVLGIMFLTAVRVPYVLGWVEQHEGQAGYGKFQIEAPWLVDLNHRYEAMPETRRFWVYPTVLLIGGAINMMLTISYGFPFGLLFLLTLLALVAFRAPYTAGWFRTAEAPLTVPVQPYVAEVEHKPIQAIGTEPVPDVTHATDVVHTPEITTHPEAEPGIIEPGTAID